MKVIGAILFVLIASHCASAQSGERERSVRQTVDAFACSSQPARAQSAGPSPQPLSTPAPAVSDDRVLREAAELARFGQRGSNARAIALKGYERLLLQNPCSAAAPLLRALRDDLRE